MLKDIQLLIQSSIRINREKIIYFDPFRINKNYNDADIIFITHSHYDHYSEEDIDKVKKDSTIFVIPEDLKSSLINYGIAEEKIVTVKPDENYNIENIFFETISAYNINKQFHPKLNNWVGYILTLDNVRYYIAGDTDINEENKKVKCDVAFVPVRRNLYNDI